ncbi:MAG: enoyl-CoA hydratase-related protein [Chloroflexi bacterium]|nr:enoyl-CoA hydratase-related protein [Chloroflexota bacterium]
MPDVLYEKNAEQHYAVFTLNRPDRLNAIGGRLMVELLESLDDFTNDPEMRVGIVTGAGRAFCAGADMREGADRDAATKALAARRDAGEITEDEFKAEVTALAPPAPVKFDLFSPNPKPFIAAINGLAVGGGMHFVMDCDIRIASSESYLGLPEPKRGIAASYGSQYLGRMIAPGEAMFYLLTAENIPIDEAHRVGLVHEVLEPEKLMDRAVEIAELIARNAPLAVRASKAMALFQRRNDEDDLKEYSDPITSEVMVSEDVVEGRRAFVEKRPPRWTGS